MSKDTPRPDTDAADDAANNAAADVAADVADDMADGVTGAAEDEIDAPAAAVGEDAPEPETDQETDQAPDQETNSIEDLMAQLEQAQAKADEYLDSLQRERATFQNYKKRIEREREDQRQAITGGLLLKLLPTLDDFHRAMAAVPADQRDQWFEGVALIQRKLERFLEDAGVTEIEAEGQPFDPKFHEAISVDADSEAESGTITQVLQRGYKHGERVLRPAMVRVAE
ncbi:MAG: nucleotide exchange factor GrpE [Anaerolineae bacterium]|nr:nucleotide exchange factor GrpE [Anaerolineae bacterium]